MESTPLKTLAHRLVDNLPDNATWDDLLYEIHARRFLETDQETSEAGPSVTGETRETIDEYLEKARAKRRLDDLRQARGMWADRQDLPDFDALRREWDRRSEET